MQFFYERAYVERQEVIEQSNCPSYSMASENNIVLFTTEERVRLMVIARLGVVSSLI